MRESLITGVFVGGGFRAGRSTAIPVTWWQVKNRALKMPWWVITARVLFSLWKTGDFSSHFWICNFKFLLTFYQSSYFSPLLLHLLAGLSRPLSTVCWVKVGPKVACITGLVSGTRTRGGRESTDGFIITAPLCLSPSQTGINTSQVAHCLEMFVFYFKISNKIGFVNIFTLFFNSYIFCFH